MDVFKDLSEKIIAQGEEVLQDDDSQKLELQEILLNTREQSQRMELLIKNQIEVKDKMIDRLYEELDFYRQGAADRFADQLIKAVIKIRKDMLRLTMSDQWENMSADDLRKEYQYCLLDITDLLEGQNVDPYSSQPGDSFNASFHYAKAEITKDISQDKKIKKSISEGYTKGDRVLIPERVIVYQYRD